MYLLWLLFIGALLVTAVTDYLYLQIYRFATIFLIPLFLMSAYAGAAPVSLYESLLGILVGYGVLWLFRAVYAAYRGIEGLGQGDLELLSMIGSFLGPIAVFYTIMFGSILGSILAFALILLKKADTKTALPFGTFLVAGCLLYIRFSSCGI